jgi:hypothetical protein
MFILVALTFTVIIVYASYVQTHEKKTKNDDDTSNS